MSDRTTVGDRPYITTLVIEDFEEKAVVKLNIKTFPTQWLFKFTDKHGVLLQSLNLNPEIQNPKYVRLNLNVEINGNDFEDSIIDANLIALRNGYYLHS